MGLQENDTTAVILLVQFLSHGQVKKNVAWLFPEDGDVDLAAAFFRNFLWTKETMGQNTKSEASKFSKLLLKYTKQKDLCRVPACSARAWLVHIWQDVPSTRPNLDLLVSCVVRWLADPYEMQGQWFKPIPYMHRSQSQGFGLFKRLLNYHLGFSISYFCWQCLVCLAAFWSCFGLPLEPWRSESCLLRDSWRGNGSPKSCQRGKMDRLSSFAGGGC